MSEEAKCVCCGSSFEKRSVSILADLCYACVAKGIEDAAAMLRDLQAYAAKYRHAPTFLTEFGPWLLRQFPM